MKLVNYFLRPDLQAAFCNMMGYTPVKRSAMPLLTAEVRAQQPELDAPAPRSPTSNGGPTMLRKRPSASRSGSSRLRPKSGTRKSVSRGRGIGSNRVAVFMLPAVLFMGAVFLLPLLVVVYTSSARAASPCSTIASSSLAPFICWC